MSSQYSRSLPSRPDFDQQRKLAKELLRSFRAGDDEAVERVRAALPNKPQIALADAQFVLAREYGFANWAALKAHIEARSQESRTADQRVHDAFRNRDANQVRRLLSDNPALRRMIDEPVFAFDSPAVVAFAGDAGMVSVLLEAGADPNRRSNWWAGPFHALHNASAESAKLLLAAGAVPDACAAAHLDRLDLLEQMILEDPKRVHERGGDGKTPLHFAVSREAVDLLLKAGADIDARDVDHRSTAAEWMLDRTRGAGRYELARYLVGRGATADIFLATALGLTQRVQKALEQSPALLNLRTGRGDYAPKVPSSYHIYFWTIGDARSPLDVAAQFEQWETLDSMLKFASPLQQFHLACRRGNKEVARSLLAAHPGLIESMTSEDHRAIADAAWHGDARAVALMLELGFDPAVAGHDSGTALHCAAWEGSRETVAVLLEHPRGRQLIGASDARYGATPLGWCCHGSLHGNRSHDHTGVAKLLLDAGARPGPDSSQASEAVEAVLADWDGGL